MKNYGNTCYCNAVLQCLKVCPETRPCVDRALLNPREHKEFTYKLGRFGNFGLFACDAAEFLLKIIDGVDAYTGEFRTYLRCVKCKREEERVEETTIVPICQDDDVVSLLTVHTPPVKYECRCGWFNKGLVRFFAAQCLILHFICRVDIEWVQKLHVRTMRLKALVFYTGAHYTAYVKTKDGWKTFDDDCVHSNPPRARPYLAFFVCIKAERKE